MKVYYIVFQPFFIFFIFFVPRIQEKQREEKKVNQWKSEVKTGRQSDPSPSPPNPHPPRTPHHHLLSLISLHKAQQRGAGGQGEDRWGGVLVSSEWIRCWAWGKSELHLLIHLHISPLINRLIYPISDRIPPFPRIPHRLSLNTPFTSSIPFYSFSHSLFFHLFLFVILFSSYSSSSEF